MLHNPTHLIKISCDWDNGRGWKCTSQAKVFYKAKIMGVDYGVGFAPDLEDMEIGTKDYLARCGEHTFHSLGYDEVSAEDFIVGTVMDR